MSTAAPQRGVAASVPCVELSSGPAIVAEAWVEARDLLGRNR